MNRFLKQIPDAVVFFAITNLTLFPFGVFAQAIAADSAELVPFYYWPAFYLIFLPNLFFLLYFISKYKRFKSGKVKDNSNRKDNKVLEFLYRHSILVILLVLVNVNGLTAFLDVRDLLNMSEPPNVNANILFATIIPNLIIMAVYSLIYTICIKRKNSD
ncbi:hypothetical protein O0Q50_22220 [Priestia aryabhattai]|uniref:Uncharacterized protein n=1 Tax=Priestia aryabhattai TaxID=412384 RepID=A0AAX6NE19_PRIAR|nr:hypothetical protein [Priestia aryabhattai]MDU9693900.1 hypothetical protein [Priestia aryabhattai]